MKLNALLTTLGAITATAGLLLSEAQGQQAERVNQLQVRLSEIQTQKGDVFAALFDAEAKFDSRTQPVRASRLRSNPASPGVRVWNLQSLPAGEYAIAVFHDQNGNGKLDKNAFGVPTEPYGFSQQARGRFGPPGYEAAKFAYRGGTRMLEIKIK